MITTAEMTADQNEVQTCRINDCPFCRLARGGKDWFAEQYGESPQVDDNTTEILAIVDSFPMGREGGHLLLAPRQHVTALAQVGDSAELARMTKRVEGHLSRLYPDYRLLTFEHGAGAIAGDAIRCGGCHVDHAHGHIVLVPRDVEFDAIRQEVETVLAGLGWDLAVQSRATERPFVGMRSWVQDRPYLQIGELSNGTSQAITYRQDNSEASIPSQLLRKIIAQQLGKPQPSWWNWKIAVRRNLIDRLQTYEHEAVSFKRRLARAMGGRSFVSHPPSCSVIDDTPALLLPRAG